MSLRTVAEDPAETTSSTGFVVVTVSSTNSGGGSSVGGGSRTPTEPVTTTSPTLLPRGGGAAPQSKCITIETQTDPQLSFTFSAKTCLELLPKLTDEQLEFETRHLQTLGFDYDSLKVKPTRKQLKKLDRSHFTEILSRVQNKQYDETLTRFNTVLSHIARLTDELEEVREQVLA